MLFIVLRSRYSPFPVRTLMMHDGKIIYDVRGEERSGLTVKDLLEMFRTRVGEELDNDRMLLAD